MQSMGLGLGLGAMRFEQVQRFILAKKTFWGYGHFKAI